MFVIYNRSYDNDIGSMIINYNYILASTIKTNFVSLDSQIDKGGKQISVWRGDPFMFIDHGRPQVPPSWEFNSSACFSRIKPI